MVRTSLEQSNQLNQLSLNKLHYIFYLLHCVLLTSTPTPTLKNNAKTVIIVVQCDKKYATYTILPKVLAPLVMNRFDYFSNFYEYKS